MTEKTITIYVAIDGEEFPTRKECMDYELNLLRMEASVQFYDEQTKYLPFSIANYESLNLAYNNCKYVQVLNGSYSIEFIKQFGMIIPSEEGLYEYNETLGIWDRCPSDDEYED